MFHVEQQKLLKMENVLKTTDEQFKAEKKLCLHISRIISNVVRVCCISDGIVYYQCLSSYGYFYDHVHYLKQSEFDELYRSVY